MLGTMQLLAAAYHSPDLRRLVLKSTTAVYGRRRRPGGVDREHVARDPPARLRQGRHRGRGLCPLLRPAPARRRRDRAAARQPGRADGRQPADPLLRAAGVPNGARLRPAAPVPARGGHRRGPAAGHARPGDAKGTFNIAGDGVVLLSQAIRIAGKPPLPIPEPLVGRVAELVRRTVDFSPEQVRFLQYGRVADTSAAAEELGFIPKWTSCARSRTSPPPGCASWSPRSRCSGSSTRRWTCCAATVGWVAR